MTIKTYFPIFSLGIFPVLTCIGCGGTRDLSTPSSRLIGHWKGLHGNEFFKPNGNNQSGTITSVGEDGQILTGKYQVSSEVADGERVVITATLTSGRSVGYSMRFTNFISKDGGTRRVSNRPIDEQSDGSDAVTGNFDYVDNKLEP